MTHTDPICTQDGCERAVKGHGFCNAHLIRYRNGSDMTKPVRKVLRGVERPLICSHGECTSGHYASGLCSVHYHRKYDGRDMDAVRRYAARVPGVSFRMHSDGYHHTYLPEHPSATDGYVATHRYVMEQQIGRELLPGENVHTTSTA